MVKYSKINAISSTLFSNFEWWLPIVSIRYNSCAYCSRLIGSPRALTFLTLISSFTILHGLQIDVWNYEVVAKISILYFDISLTHEPFSFDSSEILWSKHITWPFEDWMVSGDLSYTSSMVSRFLGEHNIFFEGTSTIFWFPTTNCWNRYFVLKISRLRFPYHKTLFAMWPYSSSSCCRCVQALRVKVCQRGRSI